MNNDTLTRLRDEIARNVDPEAHDSYQRFFKEDVVFHGMKMGMVGKLAAKYFKEIKDLDKKEIFRLCEELLKTNYGEEAAVAFKWVDKIHNRFEPDDFYLFEEWIGKYVNSWAKCDDFCNHAVGAIIEQNPVYITDLKKWAKSDNRWFRRAAAVTLILPARRGKFLEDVFEIADILLLDEDDLVQKGYGWMLKEASKLHQQEVFEYICSNRATMPRTALRYAIEKMPPDLRKEAMKKDQGQNLP